ncbi:hypothetical protein EJ110_NYTH05719 [Nymphaea thermarum]|nr:hypothetical protein EJ110_NYTH05719 [Nymphaea thermarum]
MQISYASSRYSHLLTQRNDYTCPELTHNSDFAAPERQIFGKSYMVSELGSTSSSAMDQRNSSLLSSSFLSQLISQKLNHSNYLTWKRQIVPFIKSHRLYGHIDGTTPAPPKCIDREVKRTVVADQADGTSVGTEIRFEYETLTENNPEYEVWLAHDQSLAAYITFTLSKEVLGGVDDDLTTLEFYACHDDIKRGTRTVLEYLNEIINVSDQLAVIGHPVSDKDKVQPALSGLGTDFDIFCTALEVLPDLPSFEDLKAKLFQHEASRVQR